MEGSFVVYILRGAKKRYFGCSSDIDRRIHAHNKGLSSFTKKNGPWQLEWMSVSMTHTEALVLEKLMKKQKGGSGLSTLMKKYHGL